MVATTHAYGETEFQGEVRSIDSRVDPVTRSVLVRVLVPNDQRLLKPGMLMQVSLRKDPRQALVVPEAALMPVGREQYVLVAEPQEDGHKVERRQIQIGSRRPGEVEVLDGIEEDTLVITHGTLRVRPGQPVKVRAIDNDARPLAELLNSEPKSTGSGSL